MLERERTPKVQGQGTVHSLQRLVKNSTLWRAYTRFAQRNGTLYSAATAYAAVLSLGPFLLSMAMLGGLLLHGTITPGAIVEWTSSQFPQTAELAPLLLAVLERQAQATNGLLAFGSSLLSLWTATFLGRTLRQALRAVTAPALSGDPLRDRLAGISATFIALFAAIAWIGILGIAGGLLVQQPFLWRSLLGLGASWLVFVALYLFLLPGGRRPSRAITLSGFLAAIAWEVTKAILAVFARGIGHSSEVYGLLSALVALLLAANAAALITLYGATLAVTLDDQRFHRAEQST